MFKKAHLIALCAIVSLTGVSALIADQPKAEAEPTETLVVRDLTIKINANDIEILRNACIYALNPENHAAIDASSTNRTQFTDACKAFFASLNDARTWDEYNTRLANLDNEDNIMRAQRALHSINIRHQNNCKKSSSLWCAQEKAHLESLATQIKGFEKIRDHLNKAPETKQ